MISPSRLGLLRDHDYRQLFVATTVSKVGFEVTWLAVSLIAIEELDASAFEAGLLVTLMTAGFLLVGLPAGAWVDRMRRRHTLIFCDLGRAALLLSVPVAWWAGGLTLWQLYAVALAHGVLTVFFDVADQSYLPHLVGRANLVEANAKLAAVQAASHAGGPGVAGQVIRVLGAPVALLIDAVTLAASALLILRIRKREARPVRSSDASLRREIGEGLRFVLSHKLLRAIVSCTGLSNLFSGINAALLVFFLAEELDQGAGTIGLILTISSIGGVLGGFVARRFAGWVGQGPAIWMSAAFSAPFALLMPMAEPGWRLWLAAAGGFLISIGVVVYNVTQVSFRQALTPDRLLGRMNATIRFLVWGTIPVGGLLGAGLGEWLGVRSALWIGGIGTCLAFLPVFLSPLRTMRTLPTEPSPDMMRV